VALRFSSDAAATDHAAPALHGFLCHFDPSRTSVSSIERAGVNASHPSQ
jgi:hypothetical protein